MAYRHIDLKGGVPIADPKPENVVARRPATRYSVHQQMRAQDTVVSSGRRVIACIPFGPCDDTFIPDSDPATAPGDPIYPDAGTEWPVMRLDKVCVTPGSVLVAAVMAMPSGSVQRSPGSGWNPDGAGGTIVFDVTLTENGATTVVLSDDIDIPPSQLQYAKKPNGAGECWQVVEEEARFMIPADFDGDATTQAMWSEAYVLATITISCLRSPRPIDIILYEEPRAITRDTTDSNWASHIYAQNGKPLEAYPHHYPVEEMSTTDPITGFEHMLATTHEHAWQLGPALFTGTCFDQDTATVLGIFSTASHNAQNSNGTGDDEAEPIAITATSFVHLLNSSWTSFDTANPGWSMGCGAYGRHYRTSGQDAVIPNSGVVQVLCAVYCTSGLGTGVVRFQVSPYSYIDIDIPVSGYGWNYAVGYLQCGTGPEDDHFCQIFGKVDATYTLNVRYWGVWYLSEP